ncbi:MAG: c-type cytochrome [Acidobacteriota bacterium]
MKRMLKWAIAAVAAVAIVGFLVFLYVVPPLMSVAPDAFIKPTAAAPPAVADIADPALRQIAERGRYLVLTADCGGCHNTQGPQGPRWDMYLAGGTTFATNNHGALVSRNLTPDRDTGLGARSDDQIRMVLRSGVFHTGRAISPRAMPWPGFSQWTDEDLYAVIAYLRHIKPVRHAIPDPRPGRADAVLPNASEIVWLTDAGR